jgi:hypothetical protein
MSSLQRRIAAVTDTTANLIAQLRELDRLREQVRKALLSARKSPQPKRRNGTALSHGLIRNRPTVNPPLAAAELPNRLPQPIDWQR